MRAKNLSLLPHSACDNYETSQRVTAWQPNESASQDIFKQLRLNLNQYQRKYNQSKQRGSVKGRSGSCSRQSVIQQKENCIRLPIIPSMPLKQAHSNKEPLNIKNRNILQDVMNRAREIRPKNQKRIRIINIRKDKCETNFNQMSPQFELNFQKKNLPSSQQPLLSERSIKRMFHRRRVSQLIEYDFSDACFLPQSVMSRVSGKKNH